MNIRVMLKGVTNLLVKRYMGPFWMRRRWLSRTQWLTASELEKIQLKLLQRLVRHCYSTVPYYRRLMDERGISVEGIKTLEDIKQFPVLSKSDVLKAGRSIVSGRMPMWTLHQARTGGSTGTPMIIYRNMSSIGNEHAFVRRQWDWAKVGLKDRCAFFMSRVVAHPDQEGGRLYAYDPFMKELILSTYHLSAKTAKGFADTMERFGVKAVVGYPSALSFLAKTCMDAGITLKLKAAFTTSEAITPFMRETIAQAFQCKVYDFYGSAERVCYIHTCRQGNYHIIPEYGLTELVDIPDSEAKRCKIIATGFWNYAMPLIRYDTGDIVVKSDKICPCGRQYQVIESIDGREGDVIKTPSGRQFGVTLIIQLLYVICGSRYIAESQMIQDVIDHVTIEYVPMDKFTADDLKEFSRLIAQYLPGELKYDLKKVDAVKRTASGKIKPLVSLID